MAESLLIVGAGGQVAGFYDQRLEENLRRPGQVGCSGLVSKVVRVDPRLEKNEGRLEFSTLMEASKHGPFGKVLVCVDIRSHYQVTMEIISAENILGSGSTIFLQKPMAETFEQAQKILSLAKERDIPLFVGDQNSRQPALMKLIEKLKALGMTPYEIFINYLKNRGARTPGKEGQRPKVHPVPGVWPEEGPHIASMLLKVVPSPPLTIQALRADFIEILVSSERFPDIKKMELLYGDRAIEDSWGKFVPCHIPGRVSLEILGENWRAIVNSSFGCPWQERSMAVQARSGKDLAGWKVETANYFSGQAKAKSFLEEYSGPAYIEAWSAACRREEYEVGDLLGEEFAAFLKGDNNFLSTAEQAMLGMKILDAGQRSIKSAMRMREREGERRGKIIKI